MDIRLKTKEGYISMYNKLLSNFTCCVLPISFFCSLVCFAEPAVAGTMTLQVEANIDGYDQLILRDNTLQWEHFTFAAVGRLGGRNWPTIISTWLDGVPVLDRVEWIPEWSAPPPDPIRNREMSSVFASLDPAIVMPSNVELEIITARGILTLNYPPTFENGYTTGLDFNDNSPVGADWYVARLNFEVVPEPAALAMGLIGGLIAVSVVVWTRLMRGLKSPRRAALLISGIVLGAAVPLIYRRAGRKEANRQSFTVSS